MVDYAQLDIAEVFHIIDLHVKFCDIGEVIRVQSHVDLEMGIDDPVVPRSASTWGPKDKINGHVTYITPTRSKARRISSDATFSRAPFIENCLL